MNFLVGRKKRLPTGSLQDQEQSDEIKTAKQRLCFLYFIQDSNYFTEISVWFFPDNELYFLADVKLHGFCDSGAFTPADVLHHRVIEITVNFVFCLFDF